MIYLYDGDATDFTYQGKPLPKSYDVDVKFLINDEFYVTFNHPLDENKVYKQIKEDKIITVHTPHGLQPFRILKPQKKETHIHLEAWPLFYADMRNKKVKPLSLTNVDMATALRTFVNNLLVTTPFVFTSNIADRRDYHTQDEDEAENNPNNLFDAMEVFKALVNRWKGEVYINGYVIRVLDRLGTNTQALLYEKKNISEFVDETNMGSIITRVHGKSEWTDEPIDGETEGKKHSILTTVDSPLINEYSGVIFEEQYTNNNVRTEQEMINWLNLKFTTDNIDKPRRSITVGTNVINDHHLSVGDSIILKYIKHDVDMSIRVIGYNYDGYDNMYKQVVLGEAKSSVSGTINRDINESNNQYKELEKNTLKWLDDIRFAIVNSYFNEDGYNYDLQAGNEYGLPGGYYSFDAPIYNNPTKAIYMGAGKLLIANSKDPNGEWVWETALDGDGIMADKIVGYNSEFVLSNWNMNDSNVYIDGEGIQTTGPNGDKGIMNNLGEFRSQSASDSNLYALMGGGRFQAWGDRGSAFQLGADLKNNASYDFDGGLGVSYNNIFSIGRYDDWSANNTSDGRGGSLIPYLSIMYNNNFNAQNDRGQGEPNGYIRIHKPITIEQSIYMTGKNISNLYEIGFQYGGRIYALSSNSDMRIQSANSISLRTGGDIEKMRIDSSRVYFYQDINMQGNGILEQSDERLKGNFVNAGTRDSLGKFKRLNFTYFEWLNDSKKRPQGTQFGVKAQEVMEIAPEWVKLDPDGYYTINMSKMQMESFKAIQQLENKNEKLKNEVTELTSELRELKELLKEKGVI